MLRWSTGSVRRSLEHHQLTSRGHYSGPFLSSLLLLALFFCSSCILIAQCTECEGKGKSAYMTSPTLMTYVVSFALPSITLDLSQLPTKPVTFDVKIDSHGLPCGVSLVHPAEKVLADALTTSLRKWTFTPATSKGRAMCMRSLVFIYVKRHDNMLTYTVPYLTDIPR
jgi:hypothetical protein